MSVWILAIFLIVLLAIFGYTHGVIKMGIACVGLTFGCLIAVPFSSLLYPIFALAKVYNPMIMWTISPLIILLIVSVISAGIGTYVNNKIQAYFKYNVPDIVLMLWERANERLGIWISLVNALVYFLVICTVAYVLGYPAYQLSSGSNDSFMFRALVKLYEDMDKTKMTKVVSAFDPAPTKYYSWCDVIGLMYHNPQLWERAGKYPPIAALCQRPEIDELLKDEDVKRKVLNREPVQTIFSNEKVQAVITNATIMGKLFEMDLKDFTNYLHTGQTEKYTERILGSWVFDLRATLAQLRRAKPKMTRIEAFLLERSYSTNIQSATLTAFVDNNIVLKIVDPRKNVQTFKGVWQSAGGINYKVDWGGGNISREIEVDLDRLTLRKDGKLMIFEPEY